MFWSFIGINGLNALLLAARAGVVLQFIIVCSFHDTLFKVTLEELQAIASEI